MVDTFVNDNRLVDTDHNILLVDLDADHDIHDVLHAAKCDSDGNLDIALSRHQHGRLLGMLRPVRDQLPEHANADYNDELGRRWNRHSDLAHNDHTHHPAGWVPDHYKRQPGHRVHSGQHRRAS